MNKEEFFDYCRRNEREDKHLRVRIGRIYREMEDAVFLDGLWATGSIVDIQLYCPYPGRQWPNYTTVQRKLEVARVKFQRWLEEFQRTEVVCVS